MELGYLAAFSKSCSYYRWGVAVPESPGTACYTQPRKPTMTSCYLVISCGLMTIAAAAQSGTSDVERILRQAREEIGNFEKTGRKKNTPDHPVAKCAQQLWTLREKLPRTPETTT